MKEQIIEKIGYKVLISENEDTWHDQDATQELARRSQSLLDTQEEISAHSTKFNFRGEQVQERMTDLTRRYCMAKFEEAVAVSDRQDMDFWFSMAARED